MAAVNVTSSSKVENGEQLSVPSHLTANFAKVNAKAATTQQMWLIKVPHAVMQVWNDATEGSTLGSLTFTKGTPPVKPSATAKGATLPKQIKQSLVVELHETLRQQHPKMPPCYTIEALTKNVPGLYPFTRHAGTKPSEDDADESKDNQLPQHEEGTITVHGVVTKQGTLQMQHNHEAYRQLLKNRLLENVARKNNHVKSVDASELTLNTGLGRAAGGGATTAGGGFGDAVQQQGKRLLEARDRAATGMGTAYTENAKRKFEGQSVRSILFELFSQQSFWTAKEIRMLSGRTEKEIRPVLQELGQYIKNGEHKGMWELKSEFQMQPKASGSGGSASDGEGGVGGLSGGAGD